MTPGTRRIPAIPGGQGPRADLVETRVSDPRRILRRQRTLSVCPSPAFPFPWKVFPWKVFDFFWQVKLELLDPRNSVIKNVRRIGTLTDRDTDLRFGEHFGIFDEF